MLKKVFAILLAALLLCSSAVAAEDAGLAFAGGNGDFETLGVGGIPTGWNVGGGSFGTEFMIDTTTSATGNCLKITKYDRNVFTSASIIADFVEAENYAITVSCLNTASSSASFLVQMYDGDTTESARLNVDQRVGFAVATGWQTKELTFVAPAGLSLIVITLTNYAAVSGTPVYYDNVTIAKKANFANPGFETLDTSNKPLNWTTAGTATQFFATDDADGAHSGSNYVKIDGSGNPYVQATPTFAVNKNYKLSFYYKYTKKTQDGAPRVNIYTSAWSSVYSTASATYANTISPCPENTWIKYSCYFTAPDTGTTLIVQLTGYSNWVACYDDVTLELDSTTVAITDPYGEAISAPIAGDIHASARYVPKTQEATATLIEAVYKTENGVRQLQEVKLASGSTTTGEAFDLKTKVTLTDPTGLSVEAFLWNSTATLMPYVRKVKIS